MFILNWILKWIGLASSQMWLLVAGAFGVLALYGKGRLDQKKDQKLETLEEDLETIKRIQNVKVNTTRDAAVERLRTNGDLRD